MGGQDACPTAAEKCLSTAICPYSRWRSQPLSSVSRKQRYNTLDFPTENRVPTGMLLAPIGNPEPRRYSPLDTLFFVACVYTSLLQFVYVTISENKKSHRFHPIRHETCGIILILSRLVDTFISRISLTMLPVPNPHNTVCVLSWEEARHWQSRSSGYSSS